MAALQVTKIKKDMQHHFDKFGSIYTIINLKNIPLYMVLSYSYLIYTCLHHPSF